MHQKSIFYMRNARILPVGLFGIQYSATSGELGIAAPLIVPHYEVDNMGSILETRIVG